MQALADTESSCRQCHNVFHGYCQPAFSVLLEDGQIQFHIGRGCQIKFMLNC